MSIAGTAFPTLSERDITMIEKLSGYAPMALAALRIVSGLLFFESGMQKLFGFPAPPFEVPMDGLIFTAGILEFVGGALLLVGFLTRPAAFILSGMMAVGYWMAHAPQSFFPASNMGTGAVLFCFVFLYIFFAGPGAWSLDTRLPVPWRERNPAGSVRQQA